MNTIKPQTFEIYFQVSVANVRMTQARSDSSERAHCYLSIYTTIIMTLLLISEPERCRWSLKRREDWVYVVTEKEGSISTSLK